MQVSLFGVLLNDAKQRILLKHSDCCYRFL
jgi:hypothetical protein